MRLFTVSNLRSIGKDSSSQQHRLNKRAQLAAWLSRRLQNR
jgi:hypothetical protein